MGKLANDPGIPSADLPVPRTAVAPGADGADGASAESPGGRSTATLTYGLPLGEVLRASTLRGARVLAGAAGLDRVVQRLNVMEVPDIVPWVKPHELLLTTGYPLRNTPEDLSDLVQQLDRCGLAGLAIKLGRYLDALPQEMLDQADRLGFPIVQLPEDVGFDDILNQVLTDVLNRQAAVLARSDEVHRALVQIVLDGGGLREVTDELVGILGGVVLATTPDGRVLAVSGVPEAVATVLEGDHFDETGRFRVERSPEGIRPDVVGGRAVGSHAVVPIIAGGVHHGRIAAFSAELMDASDVHALERAATVAALVVTKALAVSAVESKYQGDFMHDLINGRAGSIEHTVPHSASLGWDIDRPLIVVVAEIDGVEPAVTPPALRAVRPVQDRFAAGWSSVVRSRDGKAAVVGFAQEVVALVGVPAHGDVDRFVRELVGHVSGDGGGGRRSFSTGVSRVIESPHALPEAYEQARKAVHVGRQMHGAGAVAHFDGLGVFRLLSLIPDSAELRQFVNETLGELARDDAANVDLRRTLQMLLETNLNVAETARTLHFHYNTLRYRIGKLERLLGPFTSDATLRLNLALALQVIQMRGI
jgi:purine catabolism regulator